MAGTTADDAWRRIERAATLCKLASDPTRLQILLALVEGECYVGGLRERLGGSPPSISRHLALLQYHALVASRRTRGDAYYRLTEAGRALVRVVEGIV
jgi:DNA-binding transcriptional ArsR family regulator